MSRVETDDAPLASDLENSDFIHEEEEDDSDDGGSTTTGDETGPAIPVSLIVAIVCSFLGVSILGIIVKVIKKKIEKNKKEAQQ